MLEFYDFAAVVVVTQLQSTQFDDGYRDLKPINGCYPTEETGFFFLNIEKETKIDHITESWKSSGSGSGNNAVSAAFELLVRIGLTESDN